MAIDVLTRCSDLRGTGVNNRNTLLKRFRHKWKCWFLRNQPRLSKHQKSNILEYP
jgi:hypothetical protein